MDRVFEKFGNPGMFHVVVCCLLAVTWWSVALGNVSMTFYGYTPTKYCVVDNAHTPPPNETAAASYQLETMQKRSPSNQNGTAGWAVTVSEDQCHYNLTNGNSTSQHRCTRWLYDRSEDPRLNTITTEWDLVCDDQYKVSLTSTMFFLGVFFGALIFGFISDYLGRKKTLAICLYLQMPISLGIAFVPNYVAFTIVRFILGIWLQGISTVAFVHCIEFFRQHYRGVVMVVFGISWAFGQMLTSLLAWTLQDWRHMQMFASAVALTTVPYFWWIPESPRWLLVKGRIDEIVAGFVTKAARVNGLPLEETRSTARRLLESAAQQQKLAVSADQKRESFVSIIKAPVLLKRLVIMCYLWFAASMAYYVFLLNIRDLAGSRYTNFAVGAGLEIVVNFGIIFIMAKAGRKMPLVICCFIVAALCIACGVVPKQIGDTDIQWVVSVFSLMGKMAMAAVMCLVFVYAAELFPTFARGGCMALCGCSLRLGGIMAPQVLYLKNITFSYIPYITIAVAIVLSGVFTLFLPETFGMQMPNTLADAVDLVPERKNSNDQDLLPHKLESSSSVSEDSTELTKSPETC